MAKVIKKFKIRNMVCKSCKEKIEDTFTMDGIYKIDVDYSREEVLIEYDSTKFTVKKLRRIFKEMNYMLDGEINVEVKSKSKFKFINIMYVFSISFVILFILNNTRIGLIFNMFPTVNNDMGYVAIFVVGLLTSVHCVAMCGGINISQSISKSGKKSVMPSLSYNVGRVISYTVVGFIVGGIGSVFKMSNFMQGVVMLFAATFMIIMGLNLLNVIPSLRNVSLILPKSLRNINRTNKGPFIVGLLNGLMPCGPLQAMQLYALSTGSPLEGALSMFLFSVGTLPLMFLVGALSSVLTSKYTKYFLKISGIIVIVLGIGMFNSGLGNLGFTGVLDNNAPATNEIVVVDGVQTVYVNVSSNSYENINVKKGVEVRMIFQAEENDLNGCNNAIKIPEFGIEQDLNVGETVVTFKAEKLGNYVYTCWMGMIRNTITVVE